MLLFAVVVSLPGSARGADEPGGVRLKDQWGQLLFCKRIYTMPEVQTRLYSFDTEACNTAEQVIAGRVSQFSVQEQGRLKNQAEQHAVKLSYNTSEPYLSVPACRKYCNELAKTRENQDD
jgi:hypothetical protein